jgi:hypothetical protein
MVSGQAVQHLMPHIQRGLVTAPALTVPKIKV